MNCPYCGKEMEKGEVQVGDAITALVKGGYVLWLSETEKKKMVPKNTVQLCGVAEGYYCDKCIKVVAIFNERGDSFFQ